MQEGLRVLCAAGVVVLMDEATREGFEREIQSLVLPQATLLVVSSQTVQSRNELHLIINLVPNLNKVGLTHVTLGRLRVFPTVRRAVLTLGVPERH